MKKLNYSVDGSWLFRLVSFVLYNAVAIPVVFIIAKIVYGLRVKGRRNLRGHRSAMIAANHCQYLEPGISGVAVWPRKILFSAEENNVTRKDVGWLTRLLRAFGIPDDNPLAIGPFLKKALGKKWLVHFYPEGTISWRSQEPGPFLEGVFFFSFLNGVPVIPLAEVLKERSIRRIFPWWPPKTTFVFCPPIFPEDYQIEGLSRRDKIHRMAGDVRQAILNAIASEGGCSTLPEHRGPDDPEIAADYYRLNR